jgi:AcrR family transcriptional regulator
MNKNVNLSGNGGGMEGNKEDRRAARSRRLLGNALVDLMQEKRYIDITVQDILDRADVGRSTFYAHYRDKEDLLFNSLELALESFIRHMDDGGEDRPFLSTVDFFRHVQQRQDLYRALSSGQGLDLLSGKAQQIMSRKIEQHLEQSPYKGQTTAVPLTVLANFLAGSFLTLLKWWMEHRLPYSPEQMDSMYRQLVMPGALQALAGPSEA